MQTLDNFDMCNKTFDHVSVAANIILHLKTGTPHNVRRSTKYARDGANDPHKAAKFDSTLQSLPNIGYYVEPTTHEYILSTATVEAAQECFPKSKAPKRSPIFGDQVYKHIVRRGCIKKECAIAGSLCKKSRMFWVFYAWRYKCAGLPTAQIHDQVHEKHALEVCSIRGCRPKATCFYIGMIEEELYILNIRIKNLVKLDRRAWCGHIAGIREHAVRSNVPTALPKP